MGVVRVLAATKVPDDIIVVDNGSTDRTADRACAAGARVIPELRRGYGRACAAGVRSLSPECDIVVFLDGDGSDCPEFGNHLVDRILRGKYEFVIGLHMRRHGQQ